MSDRARGFHVSRCPVYRSIHKAIDVRSSRDLVS